jgi:hypothetical protein
MNGDLPAQIVLSCHHISSASLTAEGKQCRIKLHNNLSFILDNESFCGFVAPTLQTPARTRNGCLMAKLEVQR